MKKNWKLTLISYGVPLIGLLIYWYFSLTPLTFQSLEFWMNVFIYLILSAGLSYTLQPKNSDHVLRTNTILIALGVLSLLVGIVIGLPIFRSDSYARLIQHEEGDFVEELEVTNPNEIPTIDREWQSA